MDPISMIITALLAGAAAAVSDTAGQAIKDAYSGLKQLLIHKFGSTTDVEAALKSVERNPASKSRAGVLEEEVTKSKADQDMDVLDQAKLLLSLLEDAGLGDKETYQATLTGNGAISQGKGSTAIGAHGSYIGGSLVSDSYNHSDTTRTRTTAAICPNCGNKIRVKEPITLGMKIQCPICKSSLSSVETEPLLFETSSD